jgi:osmotically-inducible protein OsmY
MSMFIAFTACAVRPPMVTRDDASITSDVQARLAADPQTKPFAITVDTKAGVVHVAGDVAKDADRQAVERIAHDAPGVQGVDNDVRYGGVPVPVEPSAD